MNKFKHSFLQLVLTASLGIIVQAFVTPHATVATKLTVHAILDVTRDGRAAIATKVRTVFFKMITISCTFYRMLRHDQKGVYERAFKQGVFESMF